ncbi:unnamed protein product [Linum trigynum]|uniref:Terpene synthase metal-binding domain-containing protein n=1 Tax=Linum trigynum TaxID=586398 RepID=A0AAV2CNW6_9ROSI
MDDIVSHEFEQERGRVASSVECYMKQYGVSKQEAHEGLNNLVEILWKYVNEDMLRPFEGSDASSYGYSQPGANHGLVV